MDTSRILNPTHRTKEYWEQKESPFAVLFPGAISLSASTSLVLELEACASKMLELKVLATNTWLSFSFIVDKLCVAQCGFELTDIHLPLSPRILGFKLCAISAWSLVA